MEQLIIGYFKTFWELFNEMALFHKVVDNLNLYYFANIGSAKVESKVILRGDLHLESWNPHTGERQEVATKTDKSNTLELSKTQVELILKPYQSIFYLEVKN